ncbi:TetR/AcrR family transcriptional regulator [Phaeospirillum tilakii]|uniref:TetR/AcrR family transcriptional regulator n=1 Tax=Phaeospirillum tilakii TaxID=741673 RepID=A0ABW5C4S6_9PROT
MSETTPKPRGRPPLAEEVLRGKVVEAATHLILTQGYPAMTMEAVAQQAKIAKKTVYRFAASREELIGLIVANWTDAFPPAFAADATDPAEAIRVLENLLVLIAQRVLTAEAVGLFRLLVHDLPGRDAVLAIYGRNGIERSRGLLSDWLARHRSRGVLGMADPALAADLILSMVVAEPLRRIAIGIAEPQPAWDIRPRVRAALDLLKLGGPET